MLTASVFTRKQGIAVYRLDELIERVEDGRIELRHESKHQIKMIRRYMLDNVASGQVYFPPIVARVEVGALAEGRPEQFSVIDGTQRLKAMGQLKSFITRLISSDDPEEHSKGYMMNKMLNKIEIAVQLFEGFTEEEADQLFIDLNTKGKKVSLSKRISYDSRNELNRTTNLLVETHAGLQRAGIEQEKISIRRPRNKNLVSLSQLRRLVGYFMTGQGIHSKPMAQQEQIIEVAEHLEVIGIWLDELFTLSPEESIGNYEQSMLANFTLLAAVAEYAYAGLYDVTLEQKKLQITDRMRKLQHINWHSRREEWKRFDGATRGKEQLYFFNQDKATHAALVTWLRREGGE
ncbi:DNA sulfur modification protein DndB [Sporosarcina jeotgali]|uniref:DNA sulfur modification protein DndB n=1 Tax=Sporosarcina jeotgali TaxID=3020056 RepID=A0ABZ0KZI5_9BACL|nr:DNA sulfur modification protein DndB [Sporosarcina sp. B2O-1]WOV84747.1 DNA sulfur modification protein DndB [Sporosarcina sp. B2O-1]